MAKEKKSDFQKKLDALQKKYKTNIGAMNKIAPDVKFITTGNMAIDSVIGGGFPLGRSIEVYGAESSGKSSICLQSAAALQKVIKSGGDPERGISPDDKILYLDYEQAMDKEYAQALGLDTDDADTFIFAQPDSLEDGANIARSLIQDGYIRLVIFDSVAAMVPDARREKEVGEATVAVVAKLMSEFGAVLNSELAENNCTAIFINHMKEVMGGSRPGGPKLYNTPGGKALKYFASVRLQFTPTKKHKQQVTDQATGEVTDVPVATDVKLKVQKNKVAPPYRETVVRVRFGKGFDNFFTALRILLAKKKVMYSAGIFYFHKVEDAGLAPEWMSRQATGTHRPFIKGESSVFGKADAYPDWRDAVIAYAEKVMHDSVAGVEDLSEEDDADEDLTPETPASSVDKPVTSGNTVEYK